MYITLSGSSFGSGWIACLIWQNLVWPDYKKLNPIHPYYYYYIRLTAFFQDNPGKPAPER